MNITPIRTETDYRAALKRMEIIFDAPINTPDSDEADILGLLIDEYEKKHYPKLDISPAILINDYELE